MWGHRQIVEHLSWLHSLCLHLWAQCSDSCGGNTWTSNVLRNRVWCDLIPTQFFKIFSISICKQKFHEFKECVNCTINCCKFIYKLVGLKICECNAVSISFLYQILVMDFILQKGTTCQQLDVRSEYNCLQAALSGGFLMHRRTANLLGRKGVEQLWSWS